METLVFLAVIVVVVVWLVSYADGGGDEHPGWRGIPKPTDDGWKDRPPGIDRRSWKRMQRRSEEIQREVRRRPPDFGGGGGGDPGRGGGGFGDGGGGD